MRKQQVEFQKALDETDDEDTNDIIDPLILPYITKNGEANSSEEITIPRNIKQAMSNEHWANATRDEYNSLIKNNTWELVPRPGPHKKLVQCKWTWTAKLNERNEIARYKARLVAKGFTQVKGIDYTETFAPTARMASIRTFVAMSCALKKRIYQMDVSTAFLYGKIDAEIYMEQPPGFTDPKKPQHVCKLNKSLYGLKQASRIWNQTIHDKLILAGLKQTDADPCIYTKHTKDDLILIGLYVDDILISTTYNSSLNWVKDILQLHFEMKDIGDAKFILGIQIDYNREEQTVQLHQTGYINKLLEKFGMHNSRPCSTPLPEGTQLLKRKDNEEKLSPKIPYKEAVGSLMYACTGTRPDIANALSKVSQFMSDPTNSHWQAVKHIMRYLRGTSTHGIHYNGKVKDALKLLGYVDADWASDINTRRSTTGWTFLLCGGPVSWGSKKQNVVARSSTEAEYIATSTAAAEAIWQQRLVNNINLTNTNQTTLTGPIELKQQLQNDTIKILADNQGAIKLAKHPIIHPRTKHIDIHHHFIREKIANQDVDLEYVPSHENLADILTKSLGRTKLEKAREALNIKPCSTSLEGEHTKSASRGSVDNHIHTSE